MMEELTKLARSFEQDEMIKIALEDGGNFSVQRATLCNASAYFEKALQANFQEGQDKCLHLPGCTTAAFELFLYWLCNAQLPDFASYIDSLTGQESQDCVANDIHMRMVRLWTCADMWMMTALQNALMRTLSGLLRFSNVHLDVVKTAFELLPADKLIVKAVLRELAFYWTKDDDLLEMDALEELGQTPGFFVAFLRELSSSKRGKTLFDSAPTNS